MAEPFEGERAPQQCPALSPTTLCAKLAAVTALPELATLRHTRVPLTCCAWPKGAATACPASVTPARAPVQTRTRCVPPAASCGAVIVVFRAAGGAPILTQTKVKASLSGSARFVATTATEHVARHCPTYATANSRLTSPSITPLNTRTTGEQRHALFEAGGLPPQTAKERQCGEE